MRFEWDPKKASSNYRKHKVSFNEAGTVFSDIYADTFTDPDHSTDGERRLIIIGHSKKGVLLFVSFVDRGHNTIRIISARRVTKTERKQYEEIED